MGTKFSDLIKKSQECQELSTEELITLLSYPTDSSQSYQIMAEANRISKELTGNKAEVHAQFALNLAPCSCDCAFCSFATINGVFKTSSELSVEEAVGIACQFETDQANAIFVMTTAHFPFAKFIETSQEIRRNLKKDTVLVANLGDCSLDQAKTLKKTGYQGVYHALRLNEGIDTKIDVAQRKKSITNFEEAGLSVGTCVEPVGPEHTNQQLAEMIKFTASFNPAFSGAARRITIANSPLAKYGMISELRMAQIVAVTRLAMARSVLGNCTHEPCTLGAIAGANLFWAEAGANPRDVKEKTEEGRGGTVEECRKIFE
ncbi:MAG: radical SAM protein, partial [Candidatus Omnitrophica bacterium]|nr:radical SAM protein [Candidatus Omnitrophota bacterium]